MPDNLLNLTSLQRVILRLEQGLERYRRDTTNGQIRDGLIQRFEFTYEISHKMLKRFLEMTTASAEQYDHMNFADLIRSGNEHGLLLGTWVEWKRFRDMRARTSHTYDEDVALAVVAGIPAFLAETRFLYDQLSTRQ